MFVVRKWCDQPYSYGGKINQTVFAISNKCSFLLKTVFAIFRGMEQSLWFHFFKFKLQLTIVCCGSRDGRQLKV